MKSVKQTVKEAERKGKDVITALIIRDMFRSETK